MSERVRRVAIVHGRVQGVGFRWATRTEAVRVGVSGSASNLPDGTVRVEAEGSADAVASLIAWLRSGPPLASVDRVEVVDAAPTGADAGFDIG